MTIHYVYVVACVCVCVCESQFVYNTFNIYIFVGDYLCIVYYFMNMCCVTGIVTVAVIASRSMLST